VLEPAVAFHQAVQRLLSFMPEGRVAEVMGEGDGFSQVFVQTESAGDVPGNGGHFHGMSEAGAQVIASPIEEDLGFVFQPSKGPRMNDAVTIPLIMRPPFRGRLLINAAPGLAAELGVRSESRSLAFFKFTPFAGHGTYLRFADLDWTNSAVARPSRRDSLLVARQQFLH
jgi:hypothetical protein